MTRATYVSHQMDVYGAHVHVCRTEKGWRELRRDLKLDISKRVKSVGLTCRVVEPEDGAVHFAVFLDAPLTGAALVEICAHEGAHLAGMLLDHAGQDYDGTSEAFAYLAGWTTSFLWKQARGLA